MTASSNNPELSAALSAAQAAVVCPACSVDWSTLDEKKSSLIKIRQLPLCRHAICQGCYASLYWTAAASNSGHEGLECPACGTACQLHPEQLPPDTAMPGLLQLLRLWRSQQRQQQRQQQRLPESPCAHLLELPAPSYSPVYLSMPAGGRRRPLLLCLHRDANNQALEALDPDSGRHVATLSLSAMREAVTLTGACACPGPVDGASPRLLLTDRYRDRLHLADLTGRCLQTMEVGADARPGYAWADSKGALLVTRDRAEMLVLSWNEKDRLVLDGTVSSISGRPLVGLCSVTCVGGEQVLLLHKGGVSSLNRRLLMRRLKRATADAGGAAANAKACDITPDAAGSFEPKEFGLAECTGMLATDRLGGKEGCLLFLSGQELRDAAVSHAGPLHGIRILRLDVGESTSSSRWRLLASVGCRCRCDRCFRGCSECCHQPRLPADGMSLDEAGRRLFVCRRGSRHLQVVTLPQGL